jgi:hypothetical protein
MHCLTLLFHRKSRQKSSTPQGRGTELSLLKSSPRWLKDIQIQEDDDGKPHSDNDEKTSVHKKIDELAREALLGSFIYSGALFGGAHVVLQKK